jgi:lipopolysaccharide transport system ATP-binding protein
VLAVGDTEFQQKCLGKMASFGEGGRTVLFVSHNLSAVQALCKRGIVLHQGAIRFDGPVHSALEHYLDSMGDPGHLGDGAARSNGGFTLESIEVAGESGSVGGLVRSGEPCTIALSIEGILKHASPVALIWLSGTFDERLVLLSSRLAGVRMRGFDRRVQIDITIESLMLMPGHYRVNVALLSASGERVAAWERLGAIEVHASTDAPPIALPGSADRGVVYTRSSWSICYDEA